MKTKEKYKNERKEVSRFMRRLYRQGLTSTGKKKPLSRSKIIEINRFFR
jgi:hypothetical protein